MIRKVVSSSLLLICSFTIYAESDMPSCSSIANVSEQPAKRFVLVAVDQTTIVDQNLMNKFIKLAGESVKPATEISSYTFSAFSQGKYLSEGFNATLESGLTEKERYETSKKVLTTFDRCLSQKKPAMLQRLQVSLQEAMQQADGKLAKSDVIHSLKGLSEVVKHNSIANKQVLIFSDMLENSSISSFYTKNGVRVIDPNKELALVEKAGLFADFGGAKIYVTGAGLLSEQGQTKGVYRDPKTLQALETFWREWFHRSNAQLIEFGMPEMLGRLD